MREPVELVAAVPAAQRALGTVFDPACQMAVGPERAACGHPVTRDRALFETLTCAGHFARHPERHPP